MTRESPGVVACAGLVVALSALVFGISSVPSDLRTHKGPAANAVFSDEQLNLLRWFDQLRFPPVEKLRFVKLSQLTAQFGFVVAQHDTNFEILTKDLYCWSGPLWDLENNPFLDVDPIEHARQILAEARKMDLIKDNYHPQIGTPFPTDTTRLCFWAWVCWRSGQSNLAEQLLTESDRLYARNPRVNRLLDATKFLNQTEFLEMEIGFIKWRELVDCFDDLTLSRRDLLAESQWFADTFPQVGRDREWAVDFTRQLQRMLEEDELHARSARPFDQLDRQEQIAELIFQLRDQAASRGGYLQWPNIFRNASGSETTPAHRLLKYGHDAVPQLIDAFDDKRITRTCGFLYDYTGEVVRVGGCARAILERISGREFMPIEEWDEKTGTFPITATVVDQYRAWYALLQEKGEQQLLIEGTESGDSNAATQAEQLLEKYPAVAVRAIRNGVFRSEVPEAAVALVALLGRIPGDDAEAALLDEVENASFLSSRIGAAEALLSRGRVEGLRAIATEWSDERIPRATDREESDYSVSMSSDSDESLTRFLFHCGRVDAIKALEQGIRSRPTDRRDRVVKEILTDPMIEEAVNEPANSSHRDPLADVQAAIEGMFVRLLDNHDTLDGFRTSTHETRGDEEFNLDLANPRICDLAALNLREQFPNRYGFSKVSTYESYRKQDFLPLKNIWRKVHGLELLPEPKP